jgi:DNA-binding MarR family transcriptional regulator
LQDAKNQAEFHKSKASQVAVGYVSANIVQEEAEPFAHTINATFQKLDENLVTFYSTRGDIEALMEQDFLADFFKNKGPVMVGFGYGATTTDADRNAKVALRFAEKEEVDSCVYILTEEKELLRPFPHTRKHHRLKNNDPELFEVAKQTKLSPANLSKLIEFSKSRQTVQFTAADLADYLQVTRRSTERILKKLGDHGYVKIVGEEMTYQQGRPRAIYQLELPVHL